MIRDGVIVADAKTQRIILWNSAATSIFGYSPKDVLNGMLVEDLVPERFKAQHRAGIAHYYKTGRGRYIDANKLLDLPATTKTGKEIRVELSLSPIAPEDESGGPYVLALVRDITERNRVEELAAQLLGHLSRGEELVPEPDSTLLLPDIPSEPRVPLEEAQEAKLTTRELEVLGLLALGKTNRQIAQEMLVSLSSVKVYVRHIINKLGVFDRTQAAVRAVELGLLPDQQQKK